MARERPECRWYHISDTTTCGKGSVNSISYGVCTICSIAIGARWVQPYLGLADLEHAARGWSWMLDLQSPQLSQTACACLQLSVPEQLTGSTNPASSSQHLEVEHHDNRDLPKMAARLTCSPAQRAPAGNSKKEDKNAASQVHLVSYLTHCALNVELYTL